MRFSTFVGAAASFGISAASILQTHHSEEKCSNLISTGEVLHLSLNIVEFPVIVDVELVEDTVVTIHNTILIDCTNAPTHLHTTVYATTTNTVTKTISTATVSAPTDVLSTATIDATVGNADKPTSVLTKIGTKTAVSNP